MQEARRQDIHHGGTENTEGTESAHSSENPILQELNIEVDDQSDSHAAEPEIREQLGFVNRKKLLDALQLHDDEILDNQVQPVTALDRMPFVDDRQSDLSAIGEPPQVEFAAETLLLGGL